MEKLQEKFSKEILSNIYIKRIAPIRQVVSIMY
jgi:hypothetical protein